MEIEYAAQLLSGVCGGLGGAPSRGRARSGWPKWLLPATGTRGESRHQSDRNLRKQRLSGFRRRRRPLWKSSSSKPRATTPPSSPRRLPSARHTRSSLSDRSFGSTLRARSQRLRPKLRAAQRSRRCPTLHCFPVGSRSRSETKSSLRSASEVRRAATKTRPVPKPASRASRMILPTHGECAGRSPRRGRNRRSLTAPTDT